MSGERRRRRHRRKGKLKKRLEITREWQQHDVLIIVFFDVVFRAGRVKKSETQ